MFQSSPLTRRQALRIGTLSFGGLTLPSLLRASSHPISCILLFQNGGCCQLSSWDPKPDAPSDIRGRFGSVPTSIPGIHFGEHLPLTAKIAHRLTIIRSMTSDVAIHDLARRYIASGTRPRTELIHPSIGAIVAKELAPSAGLPPHVVVPDRQDYAEGGFLGPAFDPFPSGDPRDPQYRIKDVALPDGVSMDEIQANRRLLQALDSGFQSKLQTPVTGAPVISAMDEFYAKAFALISSSATKEAFNIHAEPGTLRDRYGRSSIGQGALLARRLVESGVRLVTVNHGGYDSHTSHEPGYAKILPEFDRAFSALIEDLAQRGRLDSTLVLAIGEFGRTPKINPAGGRDHWPNVFSVAMAGARLPQGLIIGSSDQTGAAVKDRPIKIEDLASSIFKILGIDSHKAYQGPNRPVLINKDGHPIPELFA